MLTNSMGLQNPTNDLEIVTETNFSVNVFEFFCSYGKLKVSVLGSKIIRIQATQTDDYRMHDSFARVPYYEEVQSSIEKSDDGWTIASAHFSLKIEKKPEHIELNRIVCDESQIEYDFSGDLVRIKVSDNGQAHEIKVSI